MQHFPPPGGVDNGYELRQPTATGGSRESCESDARFSLHPTAALSSSYAQSIKSPSGTSTTTASPASPPPYSTNRVSISNPTAPTSLASLAVSLTASQRSRRQSQPTGYLRRRSLAAGGRLSVADLAAVTASSSGGGGGLLRRRRAVEISDHKAVVLLHSKLKGMKLEDIA